MCLVFLAPLMESDAFGLKALNTRHKFPVRDIGNRFAEEVGENRKAGCIAQMIGVLENQSEYFMFDVPRSPNRHIRVIIS